MTSYLDMLKCNRCGVEYHPESTVSGRLVPHCPDLQQQRIDGVVTPLFPFVKETENG